MIEVRGLNRLWGEMTYAVVVRLGLSALLGVAIASLFRFSGDVFNTIVIMAAMPTAMMSLVIGTRSGLRSDVLAGAVVVTTVLATLTLPALAGGAPVSGWGERLAAAVAARSSQVVLGLDPDPARVPGGAEGARAFCRRAIAGAGPACVAVKIQLAILRALRHRRAGRPSSGWPPPPPRPGCW